jgi:hypothetical protein
MSGGCLPEVAPPVFVLSHQSFTAAILSQKKQFDLQSDGQQQVAESHLTDSMPPLDYHTASILSGGHASLSAGLAQQCHRLNCILRARHSGGLSHDSLILPVTYLITLLRR